MDYGYGSAHKYPEHAVGIVTVVLQGTSLSHKKIAGLAQVSVNVVHLASRAIG